MKRTGNLFNPITDFRNLYIAFKKAFKGTNRTEECLAFHFNMEKELLQLQKELKEKSYKPGEYKNFKIYEPKERIISVALFRDRVVHHAIVNIMEPVYEKVFIYNSYATRKNKGTHKAILKAQIFIRTNKWFLKADIRKYFESVNHDILIDIIKQKIKDKDTLELLETIIRNGGVDGRGLPIGNLTSQFLANVYLNPFDYFIKEELGIKQYVRYMDDFVVFSDSKEFLKDIRREMESYLDRRLKLGLKYNALIINQRLNGLSFLGARIFPNILKIKKESLKRCMSKLNQKTREWENGILPDERFIMSVSSINGYLSFFNSYMLRKSIFEGKC
ncbi:MAG: reverse transcriptase domain-containing protein [Nitrospirae bacterium YQR-1]